MERTGNDPDLFIASLPAAIRDDMRVLDALIAAAMPGETRTLWEGVFWGGHRAEDRRIRRLHRQPVER